MAHILPDPVGPSWRCPSCLTTLTYTGQSRVPVMMECPRCGKWMDRDEPAFIAKGDGQ